ncbi:MAG TPA: hypothetical protein VFJ74_08460 [Gemmatimonadaceae bacterium]|nr:hypothetical protein [Gemmatimonadaceae bacterium]
MRVGRRRGWRLAATTVLLTVACNGDRSLATPEGSLGTARPALNLVFSGTTTQVGDTLVTQFAVDNADTTKVQLFNTTNVKFTPNSVCDLASSYGPGEWDQPCTPNVGPVVITAKGWHDENGQPRVDFQPHLRFNPAASAVVLSFRDEYGTGAALRIDYCNDAGLCYDESQADPSLVTRYNSASRKYHRRIKHFSGYNISTGNAALSDSTP